MKMKEFLIYGLPLIAAFIWFCLAINCIVFSFFTSSDINEIKNLKIKTNFITEEQSLDNKNNIIFKNIENFMENNETNIYDSFFNKYNLKEGENLIKNEDLKDNYNGLYKLNLAIAITFIIMICFLIFIVICFGSLFDVNRGGSGESCSICAGGCWIILKILFDLIYLGIFIGYFINYKNDFDDDLINFFNNIDNNVEQNAFEDYYNCLFKLRKYLLINLISLSVNAFIWLFGSLTYIIICLKKS